MCGCVCVYVCVFVYPFLCLTVNPHAADSVGEWRGRTPYPHHGHVRLREASVDSFSCPQGSLSFFLLSTSFILLSIFLSISSKISFILHISSLPSTIFSIYLQPSLPYSSLIPFSSALPSLSILPPPTSTAHPPQVLSVCPSNKTAIIQAGSQLPRFLSIYCITLLHCTALYCIVFYSIVFYCVVINFIVLYCILLCCTKFNCIVLCFIVLFCILLRCHSLYGFLIWVLTDLPTSRHLFRRHAGVDSETVE